jgi:hypothetical protein
MERTGTFRVNERAVNCSLVLVSCDVSNFSAAKVKQLSTRLQSELSDELCDRVQWSVLGSYPL